MFLPTDGCEPLKFHNFVVIHRVSCPRCGIIISKLRTGQKNVLAKVVVIFPCYQNTTSNLTLSFNFFFNFHLIFTENPHSMLKEKHFFRSSLQFFSHSVHKLVTNGWDINVLSPIWSQNMARTGKLTRTNSVLTSFILCPNLRKKPKNDKNKKCYSFFIVESEYVITHGVNL